MAEFISKREQQENWTDLLLSADSDYISFIVLGESNLLFGTSLWLAQQSVEKYLKCWLKKNGKRTNFNHNLINLYNECKEQIHPQYIEYCKYDTFIEELNMDGKSTLLRYSFGVTTTNKLFRYFIMLGGLLRLEILGIDDFIARDEITGLPKAFFGGYSAGNGDASEYDAYEIVKKYTLMYCQ